MSSRPQLSFEEYRVLLRHDLMTFIERSFYELNPQANFLAGKYIELIAATLEKCRIGKTKRLILNLPPRTLKSHALALRFRRGCSGTIPRSKSSAQATGRISRISMQEIAELS
jgi:hypothetical protein